MAIAIATGKIHITRPSGDPLFEGAEQQIYPAPDKLVEDERPANYKIRANVQQANASQIVQLDAAGGLPGIDKVSDQPIYKIFADWLVKLSPYAAWMPQPGDWIYYQDTSGDMPFATAVYQVISQEQPFAGERLRHLRLYCVKTLEPFEGFED